MTDVTALLAPVKARHDRAAERLVSGYSNVNDGLEAIGDRSRLLTALEAVAGLHRETSQEFITASACIREECGCENECPVEPLPVCHHCWGQLEQIDPYFGEDHHVSEVMWPCPTITAVVAALGGGE